jgi:hypothetical protein
MPRELVHRVRDLLMVPAKRGAGNDGELGHRALRNFVAVVAASNRCSAHRTCSTHGVSNLSARAFRARRQNSLQFTPSARAAASQRSQSFGTDSSSRRLLRCCFRRLKRTTVRGPSFTGRVSICTWISSPEARSQSPSQAFSCLRALTWAERLLLAHPPLIFFRRGISATSEGRFWVTFLAHPADGGAGDF